MQSIAKCRGKIMYSEMAALPSDCPNTPVEGKDYCHPHILARGRLLWQVRARPESEFSDRDWAKEPA